MRHAIDAMKDLVDVAQSELREATARRDVDSINYCAERLDDLERALRVLRWLRSGGWTAQRSRYNERKSDDTST